MRNRSQEVALKFQWPLTEHVGFNFCKWEDVDNNSQQHSWTHRLRHRRRAPKNTCTHIYRCIYTHAVCVKEVSKAIKLEQKESVVARATQRHRTEQTNTIQPNDPPSDRVSKLELLMRKRQLDIR